MVQQGEAMEVIAEKFNASFQTQVVHIHGYRYG